MALALAWIAGAAAAMAAVRKLNPAPPGVVGLLLVSGYAAACGAAWTGMGVLLARALRGAAWPVEPGHWLLVAAGVRLGLDLLIRLALPHAFRSPQAVLDAAMCCSFVLPLLSRSLPALWKGCFGLLCALSAWPLIAIAIDGLSFGPSPRWLASSAAWIALREPELVAAIAIALAGADWRTFRQRNWLHWTGLGVCVWLALIALLPK